MTAVYQLSNTLTELFSFDGSQFALILSGLIGTFITGHVTGMVMRTMSRT